MTEAALLAAVLDNPDDDAPRLIFADWLDENGLGERAEFIRVQCELWSDCTRERGAGVICVNKRHIALRRREREILLGGCGAQHEWVLRHARSDWFGRAPGEWEWRRGFVESVTCTAADWLAHGDAILAAQPVREVTLTTQPRVSYNSRMQGYPTNCWLRGDPGKVAMNEMAIVRAIGNGGRVPTLAEVAEALLRNRFARVKTWLLPPVPGHVVDDYTPDMPLGVSPFIAG